jgi:hypothetical protein
VSGGDLQLVRSLYGGGQDPKPATAPNLPDASYTSPEAAQAVRASQGVDAIGRAQTPENIASTQQAGIEANLGEAQMRQRAAQEYLQDVAVRAAAEAYEAKGFFPNLGYGMGTVAKKIGDAAAWTLGAAFKSGAALAAGVSGNAWDAMSGKSFGQGWEVGSQTLHRMTGTSDPSILDLIPGISGVEDGMTLGQRADEELQRKLGQSSIFWETGGHIASMVIDPFGVGKSAASVTRILGGATERGIARIVSRGTPGAAEALKEGRVWQFMAQQPSWKTAAGLIDRAAPILSETVQASAANIAQSFAMTPDAQRADAVKMAAYMTPFLLPIMRFGEALGGAAMRWGMSAEETARIAAAYKLLEAGKIGFDDVGRVVAANSRLPARMVGQLAASAAEGTAFMGLDPASHEEVRKALSGEDPEAWGRLVYQYLGTWAGVAAGKAMMPSHLTPFFKAVQPDSNSLNVFLAAEANRRASVEKPTPVPLAQEPVQRTPAEQAAIEARGHVRHGGPAPRGRVRRRGRPGRVGAAAPEAGRRRAGPRASGGRQEGGGAAPELRMGGGPVAGAAARLVGARSRRRDPGRRPHLRTRPQGRPRPRRGRRDGAAVRPQAGGDSPRQRDADGRLRGPAAPGSRDGRVPRRGRPPDARRPGPDRAVRAAARRPRVPARRVPRGGVRHLG